MRTQLKSGLLKNMDLKSKSKKLFNYNLFHKFELV
jgi:hypothetical protein